MSSNGRAPTRARWLDVHLDREERYPSEEIVDRPEPLPTAGISLGRLVCRCEPLVKFALKPLGGVDRPQEPDLLSDRKSLDPLAKVCCEADLDAPVRGTLDEIYCAGMTPLAQSEIDATRSQVP